MRTNFHNPRRAIALATALCITGGTVAVSAQNIPELDLSLVAALETRFQRPEIGDWGRVSGLVVPGGSVVRVVEAVRLARAHLHLKLLLTGPSDEEIAAAFGAEGISRDRIILERSANNTYENAIRSKVLAAPQLGDRWLLVTSAHHMPRAIGAFHRAAFFVEPWPVDEGIRHLASRSDIARHEWLGLVAYWLRGRTIAIFPGRQHLKEPRLRG